MFGSDDSECPKLLALGDPSPVISRNLAGAGRFVLCCEHGGNAIPSTLGSFGLPASELYRHIAWDIGAAELTHQLSQRLDCPAVLQRYSRLIMDCNRDPMHEGAFVTIADGTEIGANLDLSAEDRLRREEAIYRPFHAAVDAACEARRADRWPFCFVTVHSFNPRIGDVMRPWHVGIIYNQAPTFSKAMIKWLRAHTDFEVGDNQPYSPMDGVDHTFRLQAEVKSIPYAMVEIRNELIDCAEGVAQWSELLARALTECASDLFANTPYPNPTIAATSNDE